MFVYYLKSDKSPTHKERGCRKLDKITVCVYVRSIRKKCKNTISD